MSSEKAKLHADPLGDLWSAILVRRAAAGTDLPPGIARRLTPEWLDAVTMAEQDHEHGIEDWLRAIESRHADDPGRVGSIRSALEGARDDPGGDPMGGSPGAGLSPNGVGGEEREWPTPRLVAMPEVEPFPVEHLPPQAREFVRAVAASIGCPVDFVAAPLIVVAGAAIGRSASLMLKPGYFAPASLYLMNVGGPSSGKSPALDAVVRPMWQADEELHDAFRKAREEFEEEMGAYSAAPKGGKPAKPARPVIRSAVLDDVTVEAIAVHLAANPRGLLVSRDEGSAWVAGLNQYKSGGKGADRQFWLSALFGKPVRGDRKGNADQEPVRISHPFVSVVGNLTPDMLGELSDSRNRADGFVERILLVIPDAGRRPHWSDGGIPEEARKGWAEIVELLRGRDMKEVEGKPCPAVVGLAADAKVEWIAWYDGHVDGVNDPGYNPADQGAEGKLQDFAARFALILHLLDLSSDPTLGDRAELPPVTRRAVVGAIALWRYFRSHSRRARWLMTGGLDDRAAVAVVAWIRRGGRRSFSVRDLAADLQWLRDRPDWPEGILGRMERCNIVRQRPDPGRPQGTRGQRPSPTYEVHPGILQTNNGREGARNTRNTPEAGPEVRDGDSGVFRESREGVEEEESGGPSGSGSRARGGA